MMTKTNRREGRGIRAGGGKRSTKTRAASMRPHDHLLLLFLAFVVFLIQQLQVGDCTAAGSFRPRMTTRRGMTTMAADVAAFCPLTISLDRQGHEERSKIKHQDYGTTLWAKKNTSNAKKLGKSSASSSGAKGGFGSATKFSSSTSSKEPSCSSRSSFGTGAQAWRHAANNYDAIRKRDGLPACRDVYVRSTLDNDKNPNNLFWFVGKIARQLPARSSDDDSAKQEKVDHDDDKDCCCTDFFMQAALFQKRLILDYAKTQLRPQNFGGNKHKATGLELWLAPADSEMNVATNKVSLCRVVRCVPPQTETAAVVAVNAESAAAAAAAAAIPALPPAPPCSILTVGYNPEIYLGDEIAHGGLRVERDENGHPTKAAFDVNESL
jgi:hypothetical protein